MACGAFYTASETLAPPGLIPAKRYSFSTASMRLSDSLLLLALMTTSAICAFYPGGVGRMAYGAFYAASETLAPPGCWWWLFGWFWGFVLSILVGLGGWAAALFMWRARRSRPQDATAGRGLVAGRSSAGALTFYAASETLALPGLRAFWEARKLASCRVQGGAPSRRSQTPAEGKAGIHLGGAHRFTPSCGGGWGLFAGRSSAAALTFYTASETLALPGRSRSQAALPGLLVVVHFAAAEVFVGVRVGYEEAFVISGEVERGGGGAEGVFAYPG